MMVLGCLLGRPWGRGAVLMRFSVAGLWGSGGDGALMTLNMPQLQQSNFHRNLSRCFDLFHQ